MTLARAALLAGLLLAPHAAARARPARPPPPPAPAVPPSAPAPAAPPREVISSAMPTEAVLARAAEAYAALDFDRALAFAKTAVQRPDATVDQQIQAYELQARAAAVVADPIDAEAPFRALLRLKPAFELPADAEPKIMGAFRKVQAEERALTEQLTRGQRARLIQSISVTGEPPVRARGGRPLQFSFRVKDPTGAVGALRIGYRVGGAGQYSLLALTRADDGRWSGTVPGELTANDAGETLRFYVEALDEHGPLLTRGDAETPLAVTLDPGRVPRRSLPRATFYTSLGVTLAAGGVAGGFGLARQDAAGTYARLLAMGKVMPVDGAALNAAAQRAEQMGLGATGALIATGVSAALCLVMWLLVDFSGDARD